MQDTHIEGGNMPSEITTKMTRLHGRAAYAPYLDCCISAFPGMEVPASATFLGRVDTGADLTVVPRCATIDLPPIPIVRSVFIRMGDNKTQRTRTHLLEVGIKNADGVYERFSLPGGVLLMDGDVGIIGMDILNHFDILMVGGIWVMERNESGGGSDNG